MTKTGPELSCRHESAGALVRKSPLPGGYPAPPRDKASTFLPRSALSSSSPKTSVSSLSPPQPPSEPPLLILTSLNVTSSLAVSVLVAGSPQFCFCGVRSKTALLSMRLHLERTESGLTLSSPGGLCAQSRAAGLNPTRAVSEAQNSRNGCKGPQAVRGDVFW